jgi:hypothetical protein
MGPCSRGSHLKARSTNLAEIDSFEAAKAAPRMAPEAYPQLNTCLSSVARR